MNLSHSDVGAGFPVVLLHGFGETKEIWNDFIPELAKTYRVINIDLPGFGGSPLPKGTLTIESVAEIINDFLNELGVYYAHFIGHSLGGYITLALAEIHPEIVAHLGLVNSTSYADSEEKKESRAKTIEFIEKYGVDLFMQSFVPSLFNPKRKNEFIDKIKDFSKMAMKSSPEALIAYTHAMRKRRDRRYLMARKDGKVMFVAGKQDSLIPIKSIKEHRPLIKNGSFHLMRTVGHLAMIEEPKMLLLLIQNFLKQPISNE